MKNAWQNFLRRFLAPTPRNCKESIDVITNHAPSEREPSGLSNDPIYAERSAKRSCSHCASTNVIRVGACGVCTECGTSQGCS